MPRTLPHQRLLAVIETQNEIAASGLDQEAVIELVVRRARVLTTADAAVLEMPEEQEMVYAAATGAAEPFLGRRAPLETSVSGQCLHSGEIMHCRDAFADDRVDPEACRQLGAVSLLCVPVTHGTRTLGILTVYANRSSAFRYSDERTLVLLAGVLGAHLARAQSYDERTPEGQHDVLTGLQNRQAFEQRVGAEVARVRRHGGHLAVCLLDVDDFHELNDSLGHGVGDEILRAVAHRLARVRGEDTPFRLGGDEFAIVFPGAAVEGARAAATRLEEAILRDQDCGGVSVTWGVAELEDADPAQMVAEAKAELYQNKCARRRSLESFWMDD